MSVLILPHSRRAQPQGRVSVETSGKWRFVIHGPTLGTLVDLLGNQLSLQGGGSSWNLRSRVPTNYGVGYLARAYYGGDGGYVLNNGGALIERDQGTLVLLGKCRTVGGADYLGLSSTNFAIYRDGAPTSTAINIGGSLWLASVSSENTIWDGTPTVFRWGPLGREIWKGGRLIASTSAAPGGSAPSGNLTILNVSTNTDIDIGMLAHSPIWLDAARLSSDPWSVFNQSPRLVFFSAGASGGTSVNLEGAATGVSSANATLSSLLSVGLSGSANAQSRAEAEMSTRLALQGSALNSALATGNLRVLFGLIGSAGAGSSATGTVSAAARLSGSAVVASIGTGALSAGVKLTGAAIGGSAAAATLAIRTNLAGTAQSGSTAAGQINVASAGSGSAAGSSSASGTLAISIPLAGVATSLSLATGNLQVAAAGGGSATAGSSATGQISVTTPLTGAAQALSQAGATLVLGINLSGAALAASLASAGLTLSQLLGGSAAASSSASGTLSVGAVGGGSAVASSSATGTLAVRLNLSGAALASAQAVGLLGTDLVISLAGGATVQSVGDADIEVTIPLAGGALAGSVASGQGLAFGINLAGSATTTSQARGYIGNPPVTEVNERHVVRLKRRYGVIRTGRQPVVVGQKRRM